MHSAENTALLGQNPVFPPLEAPRKTLLIQIMCLFELIFENLYKLSILQRENVDFVLHLWNRQKIKPKGKNSAVKTAECARL